MYYESMIPSLLTEIRGNMTDKQLSEALNSFSNGKYIPSSVSLQKYRNGQRNPSHDDLRIIIAFGQATKRISPETTSHLINSQIFPNISELDFNKTLQPCLSYIFESFHKDLHISMPSPENVQIPIMSDLTSNGEEKSSHLFIDMPKSLLFRRDENGAKKDYIWLTINDDAWEDVDILKGDLVLISKFEDGNAIRNESRVMVRLSNHEVVCKRIFINMDARIMLLPATPDLQKSIDPSTVEFIGIVEKVLRTDF